MKIAVIPARGGSKRIPKKNIKDFLGKPIIVYSIEAAIASGSFDRVVVSTDDDDIAKLALKHGAEVPFFRPDELSDDYTGTNAVVAHCINYFEKTKGLKISHACCIYATAPFITPEVIKQGERLIVDSPMLDFAITVTSFPFPIQRAVKLNESKTSLTMLNPEYRMTRSQDLDDMYHDAGQIYWGKALAFISNAEMFTSNSVPIIQPRHRVQDIDTPEDWLRAEMLYRVWQDMGKP